MSAGNFHIWNFFPFRPHFPFFFPDPHPFLAFGPRGYEANSPSLWLEYEAEYGDDQDADDEFGEDVGELHLDASRSAAGICRPRMQLQRKRLKTSCEPSSLARTSSVEGDEADPESQPKAPARTPG